MKYNTLRICYRKLLAKSCLRLVVLMVGIPWAFAQSYTVTDLGPGLATAINSNGDVVFAPGYLYSGGTVTQLGTLGGGSTYPNAINDSDQIVGEAVTTNGNTDAFLSTGGTMLDLGNLGGSEASATGINNAGEIVGYSYTESASGDSGPLPFVYQSGVMVPLPTPGGTAGAAFAINNNGEIIGGASSTNSGQMHACIFSGGSIIDLGTLPGGDWSTAYGINSNGLIVGNSHTATSSHGFLCDDGTMTDLGTLGGKYSFAVGINDSGEIVGEADTTNGDAHASLWSGGVVMDLNSLIPTNSGWVLQQAMGINDKGQITGWGTFNGEQDAFLLTAIPEPGTFCLLALGSLVFVFRRRA